MSIDNAIEQYLHWKSTHTTSAVKPYGTRLKHFKAYLGGSRELAGISGNDIVQYHQEMANQDYSNHTISYSASILKDFLKFWKGRGAIIFNPNEIKNVKFVAPLRPVVAKANFEQMCESLDRYRFPDLTRLLVLHLLWDTGMRVSELCDIKLKDIHPSLENGIQTCVVRTRKKREYDLVAWGAKTTDLLNNYLTVRCHLFPESEFLLIAPERPSSKKVSTRTIQRWVKKIRECSTPKKAITPHCFRHGKAHFMLDNGANLRDVQATLRHKGFHSVQHYSRLNPTKFLKVVSNYLDSKEIKETKKNYGQLTNIKETIFA